MCDICVKLTINTPERQYLSGVSIANFDHSAHENTVLYDENCFAIIKKRIQLNQRDLKIHCCVKDPLLCAYMRLYVLRLRLLLFPSMMKIASQI